MDLYDKKTETEFKTSYNCPEFRANQNTTIPAISDNIYSALGATVSGDRKSVSDLAASAIAELKRLPRDVSFKIPDGLNVPIPPVKSEELAKYKEGKFLRENPSFRLPFESLVSLDSYLPQKNSAEESKIFFLAPSYYEDGLEQEFPYFEWNGVQNPLYEMAMNNFLAEIPNFFLKEGKITSFASAPENKFKPVKEGWTYYMDVHLYKTDEFGMTFSPHDGSLLPLDKDQSGRTFTTQGRYYGPAMKYSASQDDTGLAIADPAQAAYVPPYFYGRAKARLSFTATKDGQPTLEDILNNLEIDYINEEMDELFSSLSDEQAVSASTIFKAAIGVEEPSWKKTPAYQSRMPMEACIKFDGKVNQKNISYAAKNTAYDYSPDDVDRLAPTQVQDETNGTGVWVISPKFECPTFNFKTSDSLRYREENNCGTGIWGGYGTAPVQKSQKSQGLFISLEESFKKRGDDPKKPLLCTVTNKEVQSVVLGILKDTRYLHENVITLKDPYGEVNTITIGQPRAASAGAGFDSWHIGETVVEEFQGLIGLADVTDADDPASRPYSVDSCIRTVATTKASASGLPYEGMSGEFDIEAYFQAESWMTDVFSLWEDPAIKVPKSHDVANAISYHINYLNQTAGLPWKAEVRWVSPFATSHSISGASALTRASRRDNNRENIKFYTQTGIHAVVEIVYDETIANRIGERRQEPTVTLSVNQDSIRNPLGKLGVRYMNESGSVNLTSDSTDPETQVDMAFYPKSTAETVVSCIEAVGSLVDICGFVPAKSRVGELTPSKEISEAVVMIPFVDNPIVRSGEASTTQIAGRNFFSISDELFRQTKANVDAGLPAVKKDGIYNTSSDINKTSVSSMIKNMQKYNLSPQYDFMKYSEINPFVMYMFEFKDELDINDLTNIWQGLMPNRATTARQDVQVIEHELNEVNFFEGKKVPEDIRWMVFRVKKKAKQSYWEMTADSGDDDRFKFDFNFGSNSEPDYNYNWPYDFCSLIEMCKVRGGISVMPKVSSMKIVSEPIIGESEKRKTIDNAHSQSGVSQSEQASGLLSWTANEEPE